jgi:hypothetical protein
MKDSPPHRGSLTHLDCIIEDVMRATQDFAADKTKEQRSQIFVDIAPGGGEPW